MKRSFLSVFLIFIAPDLAKPLSLFMKGLKLGRAYKLEPQAAAQH